ncbi:MAG: GGDEF domain-containing protein [Solirubrobacteraceae bacterium]
MAAAGFDERERPLRGSIESPSASALCARLEEEVNRAGRHGTALSCLLLDVEDLREVRRAHGPLLAEQALAYIELALRRELRRFDRVGRASEGELLVLLPGADSPRGEVVARRVLARLRSIKLEAGGHRRPLRFAVGLAPWRAGMSAAALLADLRSVGTRTARDAVAGDTGGAHSPESLAGWRAATDGGAAS